jgi:hypothetical protein
MSVLFHLANPKKIFSAVADIAIKSFADKDKKYKAQTINFGIFGLVSISPIHTGLTCATIPASFHSWAH